MAAGRPSCRRRDPRSVALWPSRDPIAERGGPNLYDFVPNNPMRYVDVLGLEVDSSGQFYPIILNPETHRVILRKCEVLVLFGHGSGKKHWTWSSPDTCAAGTAVICWPAQNVTGLPDQLNLWAGAGASEDDNWNSDTVGWGDTWTQLQDPNNPGFSTPQTGSHPLADPALTAAYENAHRAAAELCRNGCCKTVIVRFIYISKKGKIIESPNASDIEYQGRWKDKLKSYSLDCQTKTTTPLQ